ncbi:MAG: transcriptional regulator [Thaumarchaeota archaeon]|nr:transcriptional regulator [Nitrososphaerota archaeon]
MEQRLFEKYGINLTNATEDFPKLDSVLREFFGDGAEGIERQFLQHMMTIERAKKEAKEWITIEDRYLAKLILMSFGDDDKKNIIDAVLDQPKIISDILETCNIPQTSGYRKINKLIQDGFLVVNGHEFTQDGKKVSKYASIFENIRIQIEKNKVIVQVQLTKESISNSMMIQMLRGEKHLVTVE